MRASDALEPPAGSSAVPADEHVLGFVPTAVTVRPSVGREVSQLAQRGAWRRQLTPRPQPRTRSDLQNSKAEDTQFAKLQFPAATEGCELMRSAARHTSPAANGLSSRR